MESKKQKNEQPEQKQTHIYREQIDGRQIKEQLERWPKKVKGIKKYTLPVKKQSQGYKIQHRKYIQ